MTTQRKGVGGVLASAITGIAIVAALYCCSTVLPSFVSDSLAGSSADTDAVQTHVITDSLGRSVSIPVEACHIAALDSFSGNVAALIGVDDRLMGAPGGVLSNQLLQLLNPSLASAEKLSGGNVNVETLLSNEVDLVLVKRDLYDAGETAKLDKVGIPYVVVDYSTVDGQIDAVRLVGEACGGDAADKANALADYYRDTVSLIDQRAANIADGERVSVLHSINDPLLCDGSGSLGADWIARIGAIDVSADETSTGGLGDYTATMEQVYSWNPYVVVCSTADAANSISSDPQWQGLSAVAQGRVYNLPVSTSRWGQRGDPETFLGMLWLAKTLYPDLYADIDLKRTICAYYRDVIGLEIDDALWEQILSGEGLREQGLGSQGSTSGGK